METFHEEEALFSVIARRLCQVIIRSVHAQAMNSNSLDEGDADCPGSSLGHSLLKVMLTCVPQYGSAHLTLTVQVVSYKGN